MDTKSLIIDIATTLFKQKGYLSVGLNEILKSDHSFTKIQEIYSNKLVADGFSEETARSIALIMRATIEGGIMPCLTQKTSEPLKIISQVLPKIIDGKGDLYEYTTSSEKS